MTTHAMPIIDELAAQIERLLAFMGEISGETEACWITLTKLPFDDAPFWPPARAYYLIGRSPQPSRCDNYVNRYPRYAGAQLLLRSARRHGLHVRVVAFHDPHLPQVILAAYVAADPADQPPVFTRLLTHDEEAHVLYAFANQPIGCAGQRNWPAPQQFPTFSPQNP